MSKETGGPAYPQGKSFVAGSQYVDMGSHGGMTLRDYFAAKAMQGLLAEGPCGAMACVADDAYRMADAMLKEREKG